MKICSKCGFNNDNSVEFCLNCGSQMPANKNASRLIIIIIAAILVIGAIGGSFFAYSKYQEKVTAEYNKTVNDAVFLMNNAVQTAIYAANFNTDNGHWLDKEEELANERVRIDEYYKEINNPPKSYRDKLTYTTQMYDSYSNLLTIMYEEGIHLDGDGFDAMLEGMEEFSNNLTDDVVNYIEAGKAISLVSEDSFEFE